MQLVTVPLLLIFLLLCYHVITLSCFITYLVQSHMWWETGAEKGLVLPHKTGSHEPTSMVSLQIESCHGRNPETQHTAASYSLVMCLVVGPVVTISGPGWASPRWRPPRGAWVPCLSAGGSRLGTTRRRWCADQPQRTPVQTSPHTCCTWSGDAPPVRPPSCGEVPWYHHLRMTVVGV